MFGGIKTWIAEKLVKQYLPALIRHGLTALAGYLAAKGIILPPESVDAVGSGLVDILVPIVVGLLGLAWSVKDKAGR